MANAPVSSPPSPSPNSSVTRVAAMGLLHHQPVANGRTGGQGPWGMRKSPTAWLPHKAEVGGPQPPCLSPSLELASQGSQPPERQCHARWALGKSSSHHAPPHVGTLECHRAGRVLLDPTCPSSIFTQVIQEERKLGSREGRAGAQGRRQLGGLTRSCHYASAVPWGNGHAARNVKVHPSATPGGAPWWPCPEPWQDTRTPGVG